MRTKTLILLFGISSVFCGNVFALSPYADTITQSIQKKSFLTAATFPTTANDATFVERTENKVEGYAPYFNRSAFANLSIEEQEELEQMVSRSEIERQMHIQNPSLSQQPLTTSAQPYAGGLYMRAALTPTNIKRYNLAAYNGGCTPPESDNFWPNKIYTSGRYAQTAPAFEKFMITAFRKEGECGKDVDGYSCFGCYSKGLCSGIDMNNVTRELVENLAYQKVYLQNNVYDLPDAFRGYALWGIWGSGPKTGTIIFQRALGIQETGKIDTATIRAAENYNGDFADAYVRTHENYYRNLAATDPKLNIYLDGWLKSLSLLRPSGCHVVPTHPIYR